MATVSQNIDRIDVVFDEPGLVANAGLVMVATVAARLGLERLIDETVRLVGRVGGANAGRKSYPSGHRSAGGGGLVLAGDRSGDRRGFPVSHRSGGFIAGCARSGSRRGG